MVPVLALCTALAGAVVAATACAGPPASSGGAVPRPSVPLPSSSPGGTGTALPTTVPPTAPSTARSPVPSPVPSVAPYQAAVTAVSADDLGASYHPGCPVGPGQLRAVTLTYWGFDGRTHSGRLVVHRDVVDAVVQVFHRLYDARFPIRSMQPVSAFGGSDPQSMAADNTSAFNCRAAVAAGPPHWSAHAYGKAVDVNTVENPYIEAGTVMPPAGSAFTDRAMVRPGMAVAGGVLVQAFTSAGWYWGGRWSDPDYQHFSSTGG